MPPNDAKAKVVALRTAPNAVQREFLPAALEILETPPSPIGYAIGALILLLTIAALAWSWFGRVDIVATAQGRIVPVGKTKLIQPLETGVIRAIRVADGDHVSAGDTLIELDPTQAGADRDRFQRDLLSARLDVARLEGLRLAVETGENPELADPPAEASPTELAIAKATMRAQRAEEAAKLAGIDQQIAAKTAEADETDASANKIRATLPLLQAQADLRRELMKLEYGNKLAYYEAEERLVEQRQELPALASHSESALAARAALERQREQTEAEYAKSILDDLRKARDQASALAAEFTKAADKVTLTNLKAPIDGTVQQLAIHTIGGVVTPAQGLLIIVPDQDGLVAEVQVDNKDVGFVHEGQTAQVKIETFNFTRYGLIEGEVTSLSRDVVADGSKPRDQKDGNADKGIEDPDTPKPSYVARISLSRDWMKTENGQVPLGPGMAVTAEIQTGKRRILDFLLSPIVRRVSESGHER